MARIRRVSWTAALAALTILALAVAAGAPITYGHG